MVDVFKEYAKAEVDFINNQTDQLFNIFETARLRAIKKFKEAKTINGGKNIRIPLEYMKE